MQLKRRYTERQNEQNESHLYCFFSCSSLIFSASSVNRLTVSSSCFSARTGPSPSTALVSSPPVGAEGVMEGCRGEGATRKVEKGECSVEKRR
jgi:uncharacterized protein YraI